MGLSIVKGMVELHGGKVSAESSGIGQGASFTIHLPLSCEVALHESEDQKENKPETVKPLHILLIEDNPDLSELTCELLEILGHQSFAALDGESGVIMASEFHPDVILCDIGLPGISGYEVAELIRANQYLNDVPLIALSGYAQKRDIEKSLESGFQCHLAKPVQLERLKQALHNVVH